MRLLIVLSLVVSTAAALSDDVTRGLTQGVSKTVLDLEKKIRPAPAKDGVPKSSIFNPFQQATNLGKKLSKGQRYRLNRRMRATAGADVLKTIGDIASPFVMTMDAIEIGKAIYEDGGVGCYTARAAAGIGGGWYGASAGSALGMSLGSVVPVAGTFLGAVVGGIAGSMYGSAMADEVVTTMGNCEE